MPDSRLVQSMAMSDPRESSVANQKAAVYLALWILILAFFAARMLEVFPCRVPIVAIIALNVLSSTIFALLHGALRYSVRGILAFFAIFLVLTGVVENLGVLTGFPFGTYYFTSVMGPKLFVVPLFLSLAYLGMAYVSWALACIILGGSRPSLEGVSVFAVPIVAGFLMVAWDLAMDPVWSTIVHTWVWKRGGAYFGVPVSNFLGWYFTNYVCYQVFAVYAWRRSLQSNPQPLGYWGMAVLFYAFCALGNVLLYVATTQDSLVTDPTGAQWSVRGITGASALVSIFVMGGFVTVALVRLVTDYRS